MFYNEVVWRVVKGVFACFAVDACNLPLPNIV